MISNVRRISLDRVSFGEEKSFQRVRQRVKAEMRKRNIRRYKCMHHEISWQDSSHNDFQSSLNMQNDCKITARALCVVCNWYVSSFPTRVRLKPLPLPLPHRLAEEYLASLSVLVVERVEHEKR